MREFFPRNIPLTPFTAISNMRINNHIRLQRFKNSFESFCNADIPRWIINIRGKLKYEAGKFLQHAFTSFPQNEEKRELILTFFESENGWFFDTRRMLQQVTIDTPYVFYWIEDHVCIVKSYILNCIVNEMFAMNADTMMYTLYMNGNQNKKYDMLKRDHGRNIDVITYDSSALEVMSMRMEEHFLPYCISLPSFFSTELFMRLVMADTPMPPEWKNTPFAMEKGAGDPDWMPLRVALSRYEIFGAIDDDQTTPGSCLSARGLYPVDVADRKAMGALDGGEVSGCFTAPVYTPLPVRPLLIDYFRNMMRHKFDQQSRHKFFSYFFNHVAINFMKKGIKR